MNNPAMQFPGISISDIKDESHELTVNEEVIIIKQSVVINDEHCKTVEFTFTMASPVRFRIDVLVPDDIINACVTLNGKLLIGLFSDEMPEGAVVPYTRTCGDSEQENISTISPGKYQSINFKWFDTDVLRFFLYYE